MKRLIILIVLLLMSCSAATEISLVTRVVDGDTIIVEGGQRVRLIGINAPEKGEPGFDEATEKLEEYIANQEIVLERDKTNKDRYGRLLRYVRINGTSTSELLARDGVVIAMSYEPNTKYQKEIAQAEKQARDQQKGLWR